MSRSSPRIARLLRDATLHASLLLAIATPALARTARVPEDFSTIQAAVDHLEQFYAADTVLVQAGNYSERVSIREAVCLKGIPSLGGAETLVRIDGLTVQPPSDGSTIRVQGIHVAGPALTRGSDGPDNVHFEACRFDAGMEAGNWYPDIASIVMRRCTLFGGVSLKAGETVVDSCTVHGPLAMLAAYAAVVTNNRFDDVPGFAATVFGVHLVHVAKNVVSGGGGGFDLRTDNEDDLRVLDNRIDGCTGTGIRTNSDWTYPAWIERNHVSRCGGIGIDARGPIRARNNRVFDCGSHGISLVQVEDIGLLEGNVVGRCGGDGIRLQRDSEQAPTGFQTRGNTVYSCAGSGIVALGLTAGSVSNNIAFRNRGYGLHTTGSEAVSVSCNDWFENQAGATSGATAASSDLAVDPLFCDVATDDLQLRSDSPLLNAAGCGLIGALGQGCRPPVEIAFRFTPKTLNAASNGHRVTAELEPSPPFSADAIDVASIRLNGVPGELAAPIGPGGRGRNSRRVLTVSFDRADVARTLSYGDAVPVVVTGTIGDRSFHGTDLVRVLRGTGPIAVDITHESSTGETPLGHSVRVSSLHPTAGGKLSVEFVLPNRSPARLDLLDVAGRVMTSREVGDLGPGAHTVELAPERALPQGIYFLRLTQASRIANARTVVLR